jgi:CMP-N-acetylneuraminic acid synthetase
MKVVIPVKASSSRVPNKNFREFVDGRSLFDLTAERVLSIFDPQDVFMSCEDPEKKELAAKWGITFLQRHPKFTDNSTPMTDVIRAVCAAVPGTGDDVMWAQVCDPLFDEYRECVTRWEQVRSEHDCLVVVHPMRGYYLDSNFRPDGFGFGPWHVPSQHLPLKYQLSFTLSILTRESIDRVGYYVGARPYWYIGSEHTVDIDSAVDFERARLMYRQLTERASDA